MYRIKFYMESNGIEPVREYVEELTSKTDKSSRIKLNKIRDYIKTLSEHGTRAGLTYIKHISYVRMYIGGDK